MLMWLILWTKSVLIFILDKREYHDGRDRARLYYTFLGIRIQSVLKDSKMREGSVIHAHNRAMPAPMGNLAPAIEVMKPLLY